MPRPPVIECRRTFAFAVPPSKLWENFERVDQYERWWPWLQEFGVEGDGLTVGSVLVGVVVPPLPYRMRIRVELTRCEPPTAIDATIRGDLAGEAQLRIRVSDGGALVEVEWTVEMMQRPMRLASRFGRPLLQWGHDRVVETTVAGFRRRLESAGQGPPDSQGL
jgi:carbon monoxide dehydrogenase subunit G